MDPKYKPLVLDNRLYDLIDRFARRMERMEYKSIEPDAWRLDDPRNEKFIQRFLRDRLDRRTEKLLANTDTFYSGISAARDLHPFVEWKKPVGVSLAWFAPSLRYDILDYAGQGHKVFIDNGAVAALQKGHRIDPREVMRQFRRIVDDVKPPVPNLSLVMVDVVGNQRESLAMQKNFRTDIRALIADGADVLIPIQRGRLSPAQALSEVREFLGTDRFRVAVPSNKCAFSLSDIADLLSDAGRVRGLHLLGLAWRLAKLVPRLYLIKRLMPRARVTTDASWVRGYVGDAEPITAWSRRIANDHFEWARFGDGPFGEYDETELAGGWGGMFTAGGLTDAQLRRLITAMQMDPDDPETWEKFELANDEEEIDGEEVTLGDLYKEFDPELYYCMDVVHAVFDPDARREINTHARQQSIAMGLHVQDNHEDFAEGTKRKPRKKRRGAAKLGAKVVGQKARQQHGAKYTHKKRVGRTERACIKAITELKQMDVKRTWMALSAMVGKSPSHLCRNYKRLQELFD